ncbi:M13-type metalloendopeptidase [uncultured Robinsoniella sp.]|uniref:M13-type metalloendopeptidase n=1 Tax=uncultured Robinsoniella sp. TaxID=904190 RepID=UPI00374E460A
MQKKHLVKITSFLLATTLLFTGCAAKPQETSSSQSASTPTSQTGDLERAAVNLLKPGAMTIGQVTDYLIQAAVGYNSADRKAMLKGLESNENDKATRLQTLVLMSRAFGKLPAPTGNMALISAPAPDLSGVPDWAKSDLENLANGGVLTHEDLGLEENAASGQGGTEQGLTGTDAAVGQDSAGIDGAVEGQDSAGTDSAVEGQDSAGMDSAVEGQDSAGTDGAVEGQDSASMDTAEAQETSGSNEEISLTEVNADQLKTLAGRVWALFGTNLKDDFYNTVNKNDLDNAKIPVGDTTGGTVPTLHQQVNERVNEIVQEIVNSKEEYPKGSDEYKIKSFYNNILDMKARNEQGVTPLKPYLDAIDAATSMKELNQANAEAVKALGTNSSGAFIPFRTNDLKDNSKPVINLMAPTPSLGKEEYANPSGEKYQIRRNFLIQLLVYAGEDQARAEAQADAIMKMEEGLVGSVNFEDGAYSNLNENYNHYTPQDLEALMPGIGMPEFFTAIGFDPAIGFTTDIKELLETYAKYLNDDNLEMFKALYKITMLTDYKDTLDEELQGIIDNYYSNLFGSTPTEEKSAEEKAAEVTGTYLSNEISKIYVKRYFSPEAKQGVEDLAKELVEAFKQRVQKLEWMNEETKKEALKKLDSLQIVAGYPNNWPESAEILGKADGGSYFENISAIMRLRLAGSTAEEEKEFDPESTFEVMSPISVNAAANRTTNSIVLPAGILQAPLYDVNASKEENLSGIGAIIAHEITHVFDDQGAQYDAEGNLRNWWTDEDFKQFQDRCEKVVPFYEGKEVAPGIGANGTAQLSENIADIGGLASALQIMSGMENPDYDKFFRNYAKSWVKTSSREKLKELANSDHAPYKLRGNRVLVNFQEFYDTYDIKEGDGMYVAPEDRINIW